MELVDRGKRRALDSLVQTIRDVEDSWEATMEDSDVRGKHDA